MSVAKASRFSSSDSHESRSLANCRCLGHKLSVYVGFLNGQLTSLLGLGLLCLDLIGIVMRVVLPIVRRLL